VTVDVSDDASVRIEVVPTRTLVLHALLRHRYSQVSPGNGRRYVLAPEVRNQAGFGGYGLDAPQLRTCDLIVMDTWESGPLRLIGHEVKTSRSDWLRELKDPTKAEAFRPYLAEWWLVADKDVVRGGELPDGWGLMVPMGQRLRAVVRPPVRRQPDVPLGLLAALLRAATRREPGGVSERRAPSPE
jgi:hypothetical protein